jgi:cytochrome c oxidase assembly protein subunit 15
VASHEFQQGFTLWRSLAAVRAAAIFQALTAVHYTHRLAAYFVFVLLFGFEHQLHRLSAFRQDARWLAGLIILQAATGLQCRAGLACTAVAHAGGAAALVVVMTGIIFLPGHKPPNGLWRMRQNQGRLT